MRLAQAITSSEVLGSSWRYLSSQVSRRRRPWIKAAPRVASQIKIRGQPPSRGVAMKGVGLGVAGGVAAGMLAEKILHGGSGSASNAGLAQNSGLGSPGMFDDAPANNPVAREPEQRPVDFVNGDGWGGDIAVAGGGDDQGGGGW